MQVDSNIEEENIVVRRRYEFRDVSQDKFWLIRVRIAYWWKWVWSERLTGDGFLMGWRMEVFMNKLEMRTKKKMVIVVMSGWNAKELGSHIWWKHEWVFFLFYWLQGRMKMWVNKNTYEKCRGCKMKVGDDGNWWFYEWECCGKGMIIRGIGLRQLNG